MADCCSGGTNRSSGSTCRAHRLKLPALIAYTTPRDTVCGDEGYEGGGGAGLGVSAPPPAGIHLTRHRWWDAQFPAGSRQLPGPVLERARIIRAGRSRFEAGAGAVGREDVHQTVSGCTGSGRCRVVLRGRRDGLVVGAVVGNRVVGTPVLGFFRLSQVGE